METCCICMDVKTCDIELSGRRLVLLPKPDRQHKINIDITTTLAQALLRQTKKHDKTRPNCTS